MLGKKSPALLCISLFAVILISCPTLGQAVSVQQPEPVVSYDGMVIIGVAPKYSQRKRSIDMALDDAARKLSFFHRLAGIYITRDRIGGGMLDVLIDSDYRLQFDNDVEKYIEMLEFDPEIDVFESNNAVFVVAKVTSGSSMPPFQGHSVSSARPYWINMPPKEIDGYLAGVGHAVKMSSHRDTVVKSYERAAIEIIRSVGTSVSRNQVTEQYSSTMFDFFTQSTSGSTSAGILRNFYVIASWTDPSNLSVWTLAVAKNGD